MARRRAGARPLARRFARVGRRRRNAIVAFYKSSFYALMSAHTSPRASKACASVLATLAPIYNFAETFSSTTQLACACQNKLSPLVGDTYSVPDNID